MKLVTVDRSQLVALLRAVRPEGPLPLRTQIEIVQEMFDFSVAPETIDDIMNDGFRFSQGSFEGVSLDSLALHDDGVVLESRAPTEYLERVLDHLLEEISRSYGFVIYKSHKIDRFYQSALTITSDKQLLQALDTLKSMQASIEISLLNDSGITCKYAPFGVAFACDTIETAVKPIEFRMERKSGVSFDFNQYFCVAPLKTESHLKLLGELEGAV